MRLVAEGLGMRLVAKGLGMRLVHIHNSPLLPLGLCISILRTWVILLAY